MDRGRAMGSSLIIKGIEPYPLITVLLPSSTELTNH